MGKVGMDNRFNFAPDRVIREPAKKGWKIYYFDGFPNKIYQLF